MGRGQEDEARRQARLWQPGHPGLRTALPCTPPLFPPEVFGMALRQFKLGLTSLLQGLAVPASVPKIASEKGPFSPLCSLLEVLAKRQTISIRVHRCQRTWVQVQAVMFTPQHTISM